MTARLTRCAGHTFGAPCEALVPRLALMCSDCWRAWDERCEALLRERQARAA